VQTLADSPPADVIQTSRFPTRSPLSRRFKDKRSKEAACPHRHEPADPRGTPWQIRRMRVRVRRTHPRDPYSSCGPVIFDVKAIEARIDNHASVTY
jgi:hypothetical protein